MKKTTTLLCLILLIAAFSFMFVFCVFFPRTTISDYDNIASWPKFSIKTFFSGEFMNGKTIQYEEESVDENGNIILEEKQEKIPGVIHCFTDTINSRDRFKDLEAKISSLYGYKDKLTSNYDEEDEGDSTENESPESSDISDISSEVSIESSFISDESEPSIVPDDSSEVSDETSNIPPAQENPEIAGSILIVGTRALEIYYGSEARAEQYATVLNDFALSLDPSVNVYSMVIPKASAYYLEFAKGYESLIYRNKRDIDKISATLNDRVIDVNIYNTLGNHASEAIYFRTDHHWTPLGAYYASQLFCEKAGVGFDDISNFTEDRREGYLGTMYKYSNNSPILKDNPEDFVAYYPDASYEVTYYSPSDLKSSPRDHEGGFFWDISDKQKSSWYSTYLRGDSYSVKAVSNECKNGRKLLIVKDSYGNALAPYMLQGFEEIYIIDARMYERTLTDTINDFGITDVLFAECTFSAVGGSYIDQLKELCK